MYKHWGMRETLHIVSKGGRWGSAVAAALMLMTACGSSSNRYLANRDEILRRTANSPHSMAVRQRALVLLPRLLGWLPALES